MVHVFPHWNKEGLTIDQGVTEVRIFSNCHTVELFLNGKSFGKKKNDKDSLSWRIPYEPGCLKAIGVKEEQTIEATRKTSHKLILSQLKNDSVERTTLYLRSKESIQKNEDANCRRTCSGFGKKWNNPRTC